MEPPRGHAGLEPDLLHAVGHLRTSAAAGGREPVTTTVDASQRETRARELEFNDRPSTSGTVAPMREALRDRHGLAVGQSEDRSDHRTTAVTYGLLQ